MPCTLELYPTCYQWLERTSTHQQCIMQHRWCVIFMFHSQPQWSAIYYPSTFIYLPSSHPNINTFNWTKTLSLSAFHFLPKTSIIFLTKHHNSYNPLYYAWPKIHYVHVSFMEVVSSMYSQDLVILHWIGNYTYKSYCEKHWKLVIHRDHECGLKQWKIVQLQNL